MLTNECHECGNYIEFPEHGIGESIRCPHCGLPVVLTARAKTDAAPASDPASDPTPTSAHLELTPPEAKSELEELVRQLAQKKKGQFDGSEPEPLSLADTGGSPKPWLALAVVAAAAAAGLIFFLIHSRAAAKRRGQERQLAIQQLSRDAAEVGAPQGLFQAKWLMSVREVEEANPSAKPLAPGVLGERRIFYDRPCLATYHFKNDALLLGVVEFLGASSAANYEQTQARLSKEYGRMPKGVANHQATLWSLKNVRHFSIEHKLSSEGGVQKESLSFYIRGRGNPASMPPIPASAMVRELSKPP